MPRSYTTTGFRVRRILADGLRQLRAVLAQRRDIASLCDRYLDEARRFEQSVKELCDLDVRHLRTLEIGHGKSQMQIGYVAACDNNATGIDLDVSPRGLGDVAGHWRLLRANGAMRLAKTIVRELTGIDRAVRRELCRRLGLRRWPDYALCQMDATRLEFPESSFDFVYSFEVLEHVDRPRECLREIVRVLMPGGALWLSFLHYAHHNALHDLRVITQSPGAPRPWAHLVPAWAHQVQPGAFVNTLRAEDWRELFAELCPGSKLVLEPVEDQGLRKRLGEMRAAGRLAGLGDEELLCEHVIAAWRKPA